MYTSGTTANPKGVLHTHRSIGAMAEIALCNYLRGDDTVVSPLPPTHASGLIFLLVPASEMTKETQIEVRPELTIHPRKHIQIKCGGHAERIVVGQK